MRYGIERRDARIAPGKRRALWPWRGRRIDDTWAYRESRSGVGVWRCHNGASCYGPVVGLLWACYGPVVGLSWACCGPVVGMKKRLNYLRSAAAAITVRAEEVGFEPTVLF